MGDDFPNRYERAIAGGAAAMPRCPFCDKQIASDAPLTAVRAFSLVALAHRDCFDGIREGVTA